MANLFVSYGLGILIAFVTTGIIIAILGRNPMVAYAFLFEESVASVNGFGESLVKATPLLLCALGLAIAYKAKWWNIGSEGQLHMGAMASTWVGLNLATLLPPYVFFPFVILAGFVGGAAWSGLAGLMKVKLNANEIITTLLMNFVGVFIVNYATRIPWRDPTAQENWTRTLLESAWLPRIWPGTRLHAGFVLAVLMVPLLYVLMSKTVLGYRVRAVGSNLASARYGGINVSRTILITTAISGGLAGLAGMAEIFGVQYRLLGGFTLNFGTAYTAIIVAWLGKNNPVGVFLAAIFIGVIITGGEAMQRGAGVPLAVSSYFTGSILVLVLLSEALLPRVGKFWQRSLPTSS